MNSQASSAILQRENNVDGRIIMLVDDDVVFRHFITALLEAKGYQVMQAEHGLDGLQKLREQVPDLILCDLSMPILNGIEFAEEVCWEYPDIPMIVISATENMSDVARALRFGIKDFLSKPISVPKNLLSAIQNALEDDEQHPTMTRDFSSQWFRIGESGDFPEDKELHWHLEYLRDNPSAARNLLTALLPDRDTKQGQWVCSYNLLQSSETMPLVFDYAWLMDGQFAFYIVDSTAQKECGVGSSLLVRALFNDILRRKGLNKSNLRNFVENVERGIACQAHVSEVNALIGIVDMVDGSVSILPAGLAAIWSEGDVRVNMAGGAQLGSGSTANELIDHVKITSSARLTISNIGVSHFSLDIKKHN